MVKSECNYFKEQGDKYKNNKQTKKNPHLTFSSLRSHLCVAV